MGQPGSVLDTVFAHGLALEAETMQTGPQYALVVDPGLQAQRTSHDNQLREYCLLVDHIA